MQAIYDEVTGKIYCVTDEEGKISPRAFNIEIPKGKIFKNLILNAEGGEPLVEYEDAMEDDVGRLKRQVEDLSLALTELAMNSLDSVENLEDVTVEEAEELEEVTEEEETAGEETEEELEEIRESREG